MGQSYFVYFSQNMSVNVKEHFKILLTALSQSE